MIEYLGHTIRTRPVAGPEECQWMALIGWPDRIFAWKSVYGASEQAVIDAAKQAIEDAR